MPQVKIKVFRISFNVTQGSGVHQFALTVHPDARVSAVFAKAEHLARGKPCRISYSSMQLIDRVMVTDDYYVGPD